jgi:hypothetical protein
MKHGVEARSIVDALLEPHHGVFAMAVVFVATAFLSS